MYKLHWMFLGIVSWMIAIILHVHSSSFMSFIIFSLITGLVIFCIFILFAKFIQSIKKKNSKKPIISFGVLSAMAIVIFYFGYFLFIFAGIRLPMETPKHFRTSLFNGHCDYGGGASYAVSDPWYYKPDCDSDAKKMKAIQNTQYYDTRLQECQRFCEESNQKKFCDTRMSKNWSNGPVDIDCDALVNCDKIICS